MAISVRAGSTGDRERIIVTWSDGNYEIERTKLKISPMMSAGDLEESIFFLHESVISFCSSVNHVYLAHAPCSRTERKHALNFQSLRHHFDSPARRYDKPWRQLHDLIK